MCERAPAGRCGTPARNSWCRCPGNAQASDGEALRRLAVAGLGLARLAAFQVREDIAAGRLIPVLEAYNPGDLEEVHAVYVGQGGYPALRVRAFLDFLAERVDMSQG